jgi:MFS family permease
MIGFGNGPTFPNLTFLTPRYFGQDISGSVIATQTACCNIGILLMPPVFGFLAEWLGVEIFPICLAVLFVIMLVSTIIYAKRTRELITAQEKSKNC